MARRYLNSDRPTLRDLKAQLADRAHSPDARRPLPPLDAPSNARAGQSFHELLADYLRGVKRVLPQVDSDYDAVYLALQALILVDSPRTTPIVEDQGNLQVVWHQYVAEHARRPDLVTNPNGRLTPAGAILAVAVLFWRPELAAVWATSPEFQFSLPDLS